MKKFLSILISACIFYSFSAADAVKAYSYSGIQTSYPNILNINPSAGTISNSFINENQDKLIVYIQDLHANPSVQKNIAEIISDLDKNYGVDKILVEGAPFAALDTGMIDLLKEYNLSNLLLNEGILSGTEYYLANYNKNIPVYGLEDWDTYLPNARRAANILIEKEYKQKVFAAFEKEIYSKFKKTKKLLTYVGFDVTNPVLLGELKQPVLKYDSLYNYIELSQQMKEIDKNKIQKQLEQCLKDLKNTLPFDSYRNLIAKLGKSDYYEYYAQLSGYIADNKELKLKYNDLFRFLRYYSAQKNINKIGTINQKDKYFEDYLNSLKDNKSEYNELFVLKMTRLFKSFLNLDISEREYAFFTENYDKYAYLIDSQIPGIQAKYDEIFDVNDIFKYHETNIVRTKIFFENILSSIEKNDNSKKITVVVSGGFHSSLSEYLRNSNISCVVITPEVSEYAGNYNYDKIILSSIDSGFDNQALANMLFILMKNPLVPQQTKYFFSKKLLSNIIKTHKTDNPEKISKILFSIAEKYGIQIEVSYTESEFTVFVDKNKHTFKINNGSIDISDSQYEGSNNISLKSKIIASIKKFFNIEQSLFMELNPKYKSYLSTRTDGNASFRLAQIYNLLKRKDAVYKHILDFGSTLLGRGAAQKYEGIEIRKFDSKGKVVADGGKIKVLKKIDIIVEGDLNKYITKELLQSIFDMIMKDADPNDASNIRDTIVIGVLSKSQTLFADHVNSGFVGVNRAIFDITDVNILKIFLQAGLIHEFSHEFSPKKVSEEELLLNDVKYIRHYVAQMLDPGISEEHYPDSFNEQIVRAIISSTIKIFPLKSRFFNKIRNYKHSIEDIAGIFNRNDKGYLTEKDSGKYGQWQHAYQEYLRNNTDNQEKFFSLLVHTDNSRDIDMEDFLSQREGKTNTAEVDAKIQKLLFGTDIPDEQSATDDSFVESLRQILQSAGVSESDQEEIMDEFTRNIYTCLELLYKKMPRYAFKRFFTDQTAVEEHGLSHCLDVLAYSIKIIGRSGDVNKLIPSAPEDEKIDIKELVYSVFMHDLSCVFFRDNHEKNSAVWAKAILKRDVTTDAAMIERIYNNCLGHKKIEMERSAIGCILHDADSLSATLNLKRILNIWLNQDNFFIDRSLSTNERISKIKMGLYLYQDGCDCINDLLRHYLRSDPARYKTTGGASIIKTRFDDMYVVRKFLEEQREFIKTKYDKSGRQYTDADVDDAIKIVDEVLSVEFDGYNKEPAVSKAEEKESLFTFKTKMKILWQIIKYKILKKEMYFNRNIVFSDIHGGYTRFLELMYQMLASVRDPKISNYFELLHNGKDQNGYEITKDEISRMQTEIENAILNMWNVKGNKSTLYVLGDILDRGPKQIETFMFIKKLSESGRVKYVVGNHDLFAAMNLFGMHLPVNNKFKGIPRNYEIPAGYIGKDKLNIYEEWYRRVSDMRDISRAKDSLYWLQVFSQRTEYSKKRQSEIWSKELAKISAEFKKSFGLAESAGIKDILSNTDRNIFGLDENKELLEFSKAFFGIKFDTEISTGMRDVEQMAVNWWLDKLAEAKELKNKYKGHEEYWDHIIALIEKIVEEQKNKYRQEISGGNWGWAAVDAMMYRVYESMEWYAYDYIKHKGWGEALLSQINSYLSLKRTSELNKKFTDKFTKFLFGASADKAGIMNVIIQMEEIGMPRSYINYLTKKLENAEKLQQIKEIERIQNLINEKISKYNKLKDTERVSAKHQLCDLIIQLDSLGVPQSIIEDLLKKVLALRDDGREKRQTLIGEYINFLMRELVNYSDLDSKKKMLSEIKMRETIEALKELNVSQSLINYLSEKVKIVLYDTKADIDFINETIKTYNDLTEAEKDSAKAMMWMFVLELEEKKVPQSIIDELSTRLKALPLTESEKSQKHKLNLIDDVSYFNNEEMRSILNFFKNNFALYRVDEYGFYYMHAPLPYDEYGDVAIGRITEDGRFEEFDSKGKRIKGFYYKGVHYTGKKIWEGFSEIAKDIKEYDIEKDGPEKIFEALALLNAIYADNTTRIKPEYIAKYNINFTMSKMNQAIDIGTVIQGHNPKDKLARNGITAFALDQEGRPVAIFVDGNMSPAYAKTRGAGSYVEISPQGIFSIGFPSGESTVTVGLEAKISENDVINAILANIIRSFRLLNSIVKISLKIVNSLKKLNEIFNFKLTKVTNTTILQIVNKITSDKDIIERLNYNGLNCIGIVERADFEKNILKSIEPVVREGAVKEKEIETVIISGVKVKIGFVSIRIGDNTLKVLTLDYDKNNISEDTIVRYIIKQITERKNNKYLKYTGRKKNVLMAVSPEKNNDAYRYEQIKTDKCSILLKKIMDKSFNNMPVIYDIRKEIPFADFDKNLSFDIINKLLSAA